MSLSDFMNRLRINKLEKQLQLSSETEVVDGIYTGMEAEEYLKEMDFQRPQTERELHIVDTGRFKVIDKTLKQRISAAKALGSMVSRPALEVLERALVDGENPEKLKFAIIDAIENITLHELKRQGGEKAIELYNRMSGRRTLPGDTLGLFDHGLVYFFGMLGHSESIEYLFKLIDDAHVDIREEAIE